MGLHGSTDLHGPGESDGCDRITAVRSRKLVMRCLRASSPARGLDAAISW